MTMDPTKSRYRYLTFRNTKLYRRFIQPEKGIVLKAESTDQLKNETPAHGTYAAELFKPEWRAKREEILKRDFYSCVICRSNKEVQVHHRQYHFIVKEQRFRKPWEYTDNLLISLCEICHKRGHSKYKVPTVNI